MQLNYLLKYILARMYLFPCITSSGQGKLITKNKFQ